MVVDALAALGTVHVEDGVETALFGLIDGEVEPLPCVFFELEWFAVVLELAVVHGDTNEVEPEGLDDWEVSFGDPAGVVDVHQPVLFGFRETLGEDALDLVLVADSGEVQHPRFNDEPVSEVCAFEDDSLAFGVNDVLAFYIELRQRACQGDGGGKD